MMSSTYGEDSLVGGDAKSVRACAAEWHDRCERADWNDEAQAELDAWLAVSPAHVVAYLRVDSAWRRADRLSALRPPSQDSAPAPRRRLALGFIPLAAGIAVIAMLGVAAAIYFAGPREQTYATSIGGHRTVALADGSQIELNTDTALRMSMRDGQRNIWLDKGEAYFQIRHDAAHPFVVMVAGHRVTDLGTKFVIHREREHVQVAVIQGRVWFDAMDDRAQRPATLVQGDVLVVAGAAISVTRKQTEKLTAELGWRRGMLIFDNTTLAEAVDEFNRYNRDKLLISDPAVARMPIDGKFRTNDMGAFTLLVQSVLGLRVANRGDETVISR